MWTALKWARGLRAKDDDLWPDRIMLMGDMTLGMFLLLCALTWDLQMYGRWDIISLLFALPHLWPTVSSIFPNYRSYHCVNKPQDNGERSAGSAAWIVKTRGKTNKISVDEGTVEQIAACLKELTISSRKVKLTANW